MKRTIRNTWIIFTDVLKRTFSRKENWFVIFLTPSAILLLLLFFRLFFDYFHMENPFGTLGVNGYFLVYLIVSLITIFNCQNFLTYEINGFSNKKKDCLLFLSGVSKGSYLFGKMLAVSLIVFISSFLSFLFTVVAGQGLIFANPLQMDFGSFLLIVVFLLCNSISFSSFDLLFCLVDRNSRFAKADMVFLFAIVTFLSLLTLVADSENIPLRLIPVFNLVIAFDNLIKYVFNYEALSLLAYWVSIIFSSIYSAVFLYVSLRLATTKKGNYL